MGNSSSIPHKVSYANRREHYADDYPVFSKDELEFVTVNVDELLTSDGQKLKELGDMIVRGMSRDNILVLRNSDETHAKVVAGYDEAKQFLSLPEAEKKRSGNLEPHTFQRNHYSGYSLIQFTNESNRRDEEFRDVYQIRLAEEGHIPWPSNTFKSVSEELYDMQWKICVQVLRAIALSLEVDPQELLKLVGASPSDPSKSHNTNLCYFHYFDKHQSYKTPQKCMVHKDHGLLTILPKSDLPGLELLHPQIEQWVPMEQFIEDNEMLLYCGIALSMVLNSRVAPATHRVVRLPKKERFSMPFEMKPEDDAILQNLLNPENNPTTFDGLSKRLTWEKVVGQVNRADGIEPGSVEEKEWLAGLQKRDEAEKAEQAQAQQPVKVC